jgi:diadenosine tetraphosphate (Ap4A) HIT family hydrolase
MTAYDPDNIFARILRGDIPCRKVHEDEHVLAFHDIHPQAPVHVLIIPKGAYLSFDDFSRQARPEEIVAFTRAVGMVARQLDLAPEGDGGGYRILANIGKDGGQEVPHFHVHLFGGRRLGRMIAQEPS